jgi:hypothetical protein
MTTGRINQVAFLADKPQHGPTTASRAGAGDDPCTIVVRERQRVPVLGDRRRRSHANITFRIRDHEHVPVNHIIRTTTQRMSGARVRLFSSIPRPRGAEDGGKETRDIDTFAIGTQHRNPSVAQGVVSLRANDEKVGGRQFGARARSLPTHKTKIPLTCLPVRGRRGPRRTATRRATRHDEHAETSIGTPTPTTLGTILGSSLKTIKTVHASFEDFPSRNALHDTRPRSPTRSSTGN